MNKILLNITFSFRGTKEDCKKEYDKGLDFIIENSDFVGTDEEYHSGSYSIELDAPEKDSDTDVVSIVNNYIKNNSFHGECYSVTMNDVFLYKEDSKIIK